MVLIYGYKEILQDLKSLEKIHPKEVTADFCGITPKGRGIPLAKIGKGRKKLLILSSIHGREWISSLFSVRLMEKALEHKEKCLEEATFFVMPVVNPDGVEIFWGREEPFEKDAGFFPTFYKNNANNINLNANFPYEFLKVPKSRQGGIRAVSEKETESVINICCKAYFDAAVSLHARGNCIFWRDKGNGAIRGDYKLAKALEEHCGFQLIKPTEDVADYSGGFENWFRHRFRRPALCVELVKDEEISFKDMEKDFKKWVIWEKTKGFMDVFSKFT